jgi:hypothetical protein
MDGAWAPKNDLRPVTGDHELDFATHTSGINFGVSFSAIFMFYTLRCERFIFSLKLLIKKYLR